MRIIHIEINTDFSTDFRKRIEKMGFFSKKYMVEPNAWLKNERKPLL